MSSLWNRSGMVERYADDLRAAGALAYFFSGGTTTPLTVFQDSGEAAAHTNPVVADANGRWPDVFVPYIESYDVQVKSAAGVQLTFTQRIPNPDPVELTVTASATSVVQTGMIHPELVNTVKPGYVRLNGRTLGNGASSATERANDDTEDLFEYLWSNLNDTIATVSGGRGVSAAQDFDANKTIVLPTCQGALLIGLDDMGSTAAGNFSGLSFALGDATTAGSSTGSNGVALAIGNLPAHSHGGTTSSDPVTGTTGSKTDSVSGTTGAGSAHQHSAFIGDDGHTHSSQKPGPFLVTSTGAGSAVGATGDTTGSSTTGVRVRSTAGNAATADDKTATESAHTHSFSGTTAGHTHDFTATNHSHTFTTDSQGSSTPFNNIPMARLVTWYIKL